MRPLAAAFVKNRVLPFAFGQSMLPLAQVLVRNSKRLPRFIGVSKLIHTLAEHTRHVKEIFQFKYRFTRLPGAFQTMAANMSSDMPLVSAGPAAGGGAVAGVTDGHEPCSASPRDAAPSAVSQTVTEETTSADREASSSASGQKLSRRAMKRVRYSYK